MNTEILYTPEQIAAAVKRTAAAVGAHFGMVEPVLAMVVLNGALWFAADLLRALPDNFILCSIRVSSYGSGTESSGKLQWCTPCPDVRGKRVLLIEDVLDTGLTLHTLVKEFRLQGATEVVTCVAVDKKGRRCVPIEADFAALSVGNDFLIGYGMDWDGRYRNRPAIERVLTD